MKILIIDNFDSFTYNLVDYVKQSGAECEVVRNNVEINQIKIRNYRGLILSPGQGTPENAGNLMQFIDQFFLQIPILGICLGHQALGIYFGASLTKAIYPMHGKISNVINEPDLIFKNIPSKIEVVRYHSLILKNIPECFKIISITEKDEIMGLSHTTLPIKGLQFHPEAALTMFGKEMITNWLEICSTHNNIFSL